MTHFDARIAGVLNSSGLPAEARPVDEVGDPGDYDAFVVGGAAYMFHWLKTTETFVRRRKRILAERPLWLFSSGPLGNENVDADGHDVLTPRRSE